MQGINTGGRNHNCSTALCTTLVMSPSPPPNGCACTGRSRDAADSVRQLINVRELVRECNKWQVADDLPQAVYKKIECKTWNFQKHPIAHNIAAVRSADVLVTMFAPESMHSLFMRNGSSLVEIRPPDFGTKGWAHRYAYTGLRKQFGMFFWGINVENYNLSTPGLFERKKEGAPELYIRDRNVRLPWFALKRQLLKIVDVGGDRLKYLDHYVNDHTIINVLNGTLAERYGIAPRDKAAYKREVVALNRQQDQEMMQQSKVEEETLREFRPEELDE